MLNRLRQIYRRVIGKQTAIAIQEPYVSDFYNGSKYYGGFGPTHFFTTDYVTLRARSGQLFRENLYAAGLLNRLVTNEINTGLTPEVLPNEILLQKKEDELAEWAEGVEDRFEIWSEAPALCDITAQSDFGDLQRQVRMESLICGDVLVILRISRRTGLPQIQLIPGDRIQSPMFLITPTEGKRIEYGVELDSKRRHTAYYVVDDKGATVRIPARGVKSGRRVAWLVYGTDKRVGEVRGMPLLSIVLQSLKEIDRYRDATQRKAAINAVIAIFMKKTNQLIGTKPLTQGAVRKTAITTTDSEGSQKTYKIAEQIPGLMIQDLQAGEEPVAFGNQGVDEKFGDFESAVINAIAWANQIPPEILQLGFSSNYSASQAALNEFKFYLSMIREKFAMMFCKPIYEEWLLSSILNGSIKADGYLESWSDPLRYDIYGAWTKAEWSGAVKASTDIRKQAEGTKRLVDEGWITNRRAAKELTGTRYSRNIRKIMRENLAKRAAQEILKPLEFPDTQGTEEDETEEDNG